MNRKHAAGKKPTLAEVLHGPEGTPTNTARGKKKRIHPPPNKKKKKARRSLLKPLFLVSLLHPFAGHLQDWERGVPVDCGEPWTREAIELAVARGPHPTARDPDAVQLVHEDIEYQVKAGFSEIVFWDDIKDSLPPSFKVSPVAVIPQPNRRGRIILDLSFAVRRPPTSKTRRRMGEVVQESVNSTTQRVAPPEGVKAIGRVLPNLFQFMADTPHDEEIRFGKVDLSDGFWRMIVEEDQKWNFCYVMPDPPGSRVRIVVPSALQMGWAESPPYFCAATQVGRDIAEFLVDNPTIQLPPHPLESYVIPDDMTDVTPSQREELFRFISVYVDDYILAAVEDPDRTLITRVAQATLFGIHSVFPPPEVTGHTGGKDPVSQKKLEKEDAKMAVIKEILGFIADGVYRTVTLPEKKAMLICTKIERILKRRSVALKRLESVVGKVMHAVNILPMVKALMTPVYQSYTHRPEIVGLREKGELRAALKDIRILIKSLAGRPTHVFEIVKLLITYVAMVDASSTGVGGIIILRGRDPIVFRFEWPQAVQQRYKREEITNSDLEMAGIVCVWFLLETFVPLKHLKVQIFTDNRPSSSWTARLISQSKFPTAARLIRALAMRARTMESQVPDAPHWAGENNKPADLASRSFDQETVVAVAAGAARPTLEADLNAAWRAVESATVDVSARLRDWRLWCEYLQANGFTNPYLSGRSAHERTQILVAFAARYRTGALGRGREVKQGSVTTALRYVGQMYELAGHPDPRRPHGGKDLGIVFARLLRTYREKDSPTESQIALPMKIFENIAAVEGQSTDTLEVAIADIITIMFFFLLCVGEATCPSSTRPKHTVQFRRSDVTFWKRVGPSMRRLPPDSPLPNLLAADSVSLKLSNQKNGQRDSTLNHEALPGCLWCPVQALARRYDACRRATPHNPNAMICNYAPQSYVMANHVNQVLQRASIRLTIWEEGFDLHRIGTHSIRASGAMALYLNHIKEDTIKLIGRWRSTTWLTYIHTQIAAVSAGVSRRMSRPVVFHNIAGRNPD